MEHLGERPLSAALLRAQNGDLRRLTHPEDPRAMQVLTAWLGNPEEVLRERAEAALVALGERDLAEAVRAALRGYPGPLAALNDPRGAAPLLVALRAGGPELRRPAARALEAMGPVAASALPALEEMAGDDENVGAEARRLCREAIRGIRAALKEAPAELVAASAPGGRGSELEAADTPAEPHPPAEERDSPWWRFWDRD